MPNPQIFFRVDHSVANDLRALAKRFRTTPGHIAKLIVLRELSQLPALLDAQDQALQEIRQFHRDLAATLEEYLEEIENLEKSSGLHQIISVLNAQSKAIDALRSAATPRPSPLVSPLIERHDKEPVQTSFPY